MTEAKHILHVLTDPKSPFTKISAIREELNLAITYACEIINHEDLLAKFLVSSEAISSCEVFGLINIVQPDLIRKNVVAVLTSNFFDFFYKSESCVLIYID